jgi:hypothetical protein
MKDTLLSQSEGIDDGALVIINGIDVSTEELLIGRARTFHTLCYNVDYVRD